MGVTRPRTKFRLKLKARRCTKCGKVLHPHLTRCKRCAQANARPKP